MLNHKFILVDNDGGNSYRTGEIVSEIDGGYFFVRFDNMIGKKQSPPLPLEIVHLSEMAAVDANDFKLWHFFDTEAERQGWVDWLDSPGDSRQKVVNLIK